MVTSKWATRVLLEDIRAYNDIPAKSLNNYLWERYGVVMAPSTHYRTRSKALVEIHGGFDESYGHLPEYCEIIKLTNPSSHAMCTWNSPTHPEKPLAFTSIFISFKASIDGLFSGCRSLIVTWAIVSSKDEESWMFFMHQLKKLLEPAERGDQWCIIFDRQNGIDNALSRLWPAAGRRYCCKHLSQNFKSKFSGPKMWNLFWLAYDLGEQCRRTKHKFDASIKSDVNKTNFVESFNATLGIDRCRPVMTLLEGIRRVTMVRLASRKEACEKWKRSDIFPKIVRRVQMHTCIGGRWQISGIPCRQGLRAIIHPSLYPLNFVDKWLSVHLYKAAYGQGIKPIIDMEQWPEIDLPLIQPPKMKRGVGRPSRNRRRRVEEQRKRQRSKTIVCALCKQAGQKKNTCKGALTSKQKKGKEKASSLSQPSTSKKGATCQRVASTQPITSNIP
ncbi:Retrotransposon-derived protein PEG10 [Bienertia sinuspersici]